MGNNNEKVKDAKSLSEEEVNMLIQNTSFTRDEIIQWHSGFIKDCKYEKHELHVYIFDFVVLTLSPNKKKGPKGRLDKKKFMDVYKVFYPQGMLRFK